MTKLMIAALALALPGLAAAQTPGPRQYVKMAGASDQYELQSSRLVLATSRNAALRRFAADMVRDHSKSTADIKRAARMGRVMAPPPALDAMGARNIAQLRRARGLARDALYIQQQKKAHDMALALHQDYAAHGQSRPLARTASMIVPVVQHHVEMLSTM